ncbi:unnamed protein product, partial [Adineta ricciae]
MAPTRGQRKSETVAASSFSLERQLLSDIDESIHYDYGDEDDQQQNRKDQDDEDSNENPIDPFSTKQFQSKTTTRISK